MVVAKAQNHCYRPGYESERTRRDGAGGRKSCAIPTRPVWGNMGFPFSTGTAKPKQGADALELKLIIDT